MTKPGRYRPAGSRRPMRLATAIGMALLIGACSGVGGEKGVTLAHIHGLGVNPADGQLYAGSHHGVFRIDGKGEPEQIAGRTQDFMGFTIIGPDRFLGSGHPGRGDNDQPSQLGLIESTDGAQTWTSLSLSGEADFHAMEAKHGQVYGYDSQSGQVMVSTDTKSWDRRAQMGLADMAVSPDNVAELLATTKQGLARSIDGGRSFASIAGAPALVFIDWPGANRVVGVALDGIVLTSADGGARWTERGRVPGSPQAVTTHGESEVYVATENGIYHSADNGATFEMFQDVQ